MSKDLENVFVSNADENENAEENYKRGIFFSSYSNEVRNLLVYNHEMNQEDENSKNINNSINDTEVENLINPIKNLNSIDRAELDLSITAGEWGDTDNIINLVYDCDAFHFTAECDTINTDRMTNVSGNGYGDVLIDPRCEFLDNGNFFPLIVNEGWRNSNENVVETLEAYFATLQFLTTNVSGTGNHVAIPLSNFHTLLGAIVFSRTDMFGLNKRNTFGERIVDVQVREAVHYGWRSEEDDARASSDGLEPFANKEVGMGDEK